MKTVNHLPLSFLWKGSGILLTLFTLLAFISTTDLEYNKLKGKVKKYSLYDYQVRWYSDSPVFSLNNEQHREFTQDGYYVGRIPYQMPDPYKHYTYKDSKRVNKMMDSLSKVSHHYEDSIGQQWVSFYKFYNRAGNRREERSLYTDGHRRIIKYNKTGEIVEQAYYYNKGSERRTQKSTTVFCKNGNVKGYFYINNILVAKILNKFTYDKVGNWIVDSTFTNDTLTYLRKREIEYW